MPTPCRRFAVAGCFIIHVLRCFFIAKVGGTRGGLRPFRAYPPSKSLQGVLGGRALPMLLAAAASLGFAPASPLSRSAVVRPSRAVAPLMATPLDAVAGPLNKWAPAADAAGGSPLDDLPLEVKALFAIIPIVGVLGLLKSNGMLGSDAPTLNLGQDRGDLTPEAAAAAAGSNTPARSSPCATPPLPGARRGMRGE